MQYTVSNGALYILKSVQELVTRLTKPSLGNLAVTAVTILVCCNWMLVPTNLHWFNSYPRSPWMNNPIYIHDDPSPVHPLADDIHACASKKPRPMMIHLLSPSLLPSVILATTSCCYPTSTPSLPQSMFGWFLVAIIDQELKVDGFCMASIK